MRRPLLLVALAGTLVVAGCGADGATGPAPQARDDRVALPPTASATDGRLGGATTARPGTRVRELAPPGRIDLDRRRRPERRDGVGAGSTCANAEQMPAADTLGTVLDATLCLLNGERADHGLAPLTANPTLATAASAYAQDLVAGSYFSHMGRDGSDVVERLTRGGYITRETGWSVGENLAWGTGALATPAAIMRAWMGSPGHRANILDESYREVGLGVTGGNPARADGAGATYATEFGSVEAPAALASPAAGQPVARRPTAKRPAHGRQPTAKRRAHGRQRHAAGRAGRRARSRRAAADGSRRARGARRSGTGRRTRSRADA